MYILKFPQSYWVFLAKGSSLNPESLPSHHFTISTQTCSEYFPTALWALDQPSPLYIVDCIPATSHWLELWIGQPKSPRSQHLKGNPCPLFETLLLSVHALPPRRSCFAKLSRAWRGQGWKAASGSWGGREGGRASSICEWLLCAWSAVALQLSVCLMLPRGHL